jgi:uncharacterized membrane protein YidH (DUF202 family)
MHGSVFGVFESNACPSNLIKNGLDFGIGWPRFFVACLSLIVYILVEPLHQISRFLPAIVLIPAVMAVLFRTLHVNFIRRKDIERGLHRGLLASWLVLATILVIQW